jgi:hypothetical protein
MLSSNRPREELRTRYDAGVADGNHNPDAHEEPENGTAALEQMMPYEQITPRLPEEVHRYFPEWADRPDSADLLLEADHNSYLAGGYSEEFGYRVRPDHPPVFQLLLEEPEHSRQWAVQIGCLHPGYPECPRPADRGANHTLDGDGHPAERNAEMRLPARRSGEGVESGALVRVVQVNRRRLERGVAVAIAALRARLRIRRRLRDRGI